MSDPSRENFGRRVYTSFTITWAVYGILHCMVTNSYWLLQPEPGVYIARLVMILSGLLVLAKPASVGRLAFLSLAMFASGVADAPSWPNHYLHTMALDLLLLLICAMAGLGYGPAGLSIQARVGLMFAPVGRLSLFVLYFWAVVHKLNYDYLNPEASCGWNLLTESAQYIAYNFSIQLPTPDWMRYPVIIGVLVVESAIPLMLAFRRTRIGGMALGLVFHFMLAFHFITYVASFTLMMYALFSLFLPSQAWEDIENWWESTGLKKRITAGQTARWWPVGVFCAVLVYVTCVVLARTAGSGSFHDLVLWVHQRAQNRTGHLIALAYALLVFYVFCRFVIPRRKIAALPYEYFRPRPVAFVVLPLLLLLNGVSPYVGLKVHYSYAMFSNLRTEGRISNHLFLPTRYRLFNYIDDLIEVKESNYDAIPVLAPGKRMTRFEFTRRLIDAPTDLRIVYSDNGSAPKTLDYETLQTEPSLRPPSRLLRNVLQFKIVPPADKPCPCRP